MRSMVEGARGSAARKTVPQIFPSPVPGEDAERSEGG
jgi:hypothetical protein